MGLLGRAPFHVYADENFAGV